MAEVVVLVGVLEEVPEAAVLVWLVLVDQGQRPRERTVVPLVPPREGVP